MIDYWLKKSITTPQKYRIFMKFQNPQKYRNFMKLKIQKIHFEKLNWDILFVGISRFRRNRILEGTTKIQGYSACIVDNSWHNRES